MISTIQKSKKKDIKKNMKELNCRGLSCPQPIIQLTKMIKTLDEGTQITIYASDRAFEADIAAWIRRTGHKLISMNKDGSLITAIVEKKL